MIVGRDSIDPLLRLRTCKAELGELRASFVAGWPGWVDCSLDVDRKTGLVVENVRKSD